MSMLAAVGYLAFAAGAIGAQQGERPAVLNELEACRRIVGDADRLACMDRVAERISGLIASRDIVVVDREEIRKTRRGLFGFNLPTLTLFKTKDGADEDGGDKEEFSEITATITKASADPFGKYTLRLEDGAVWRTTEPVKQVPKPGTKVTIKKASLGSYLMRIGGGGHVRAMRVN